MPVESTSGRPVCRKRLSRPTSVNAAGANGLLYGNAHLLLVQAIAVACTIGFTAPLTAGILYGMSALSAIRVGITNEVAGVDFSEHGEHAYDDGDSSPLHGVGTRLGDAVVLSTTPRPRETAAA